jgi:acetyl esterase/lipase
MRMLRRAIAIGVAAVLTIGLAADNGPSPESINDLPSTAPTLVARYGPAPQHIGELRLPKGKGPFPVAIVVHGGCWIKEYASLRHTAPIASALTAKGIATWNIEYRRLGEPGAGWPGTFQDWAAAADKLRELAKTHPLDLTRVATVGHSAGAHGALWIAARHKLSKGSEVARPDPLRVHAAFALDGPGDLARFAGGKDAAVCGRPVIVELLGGTPAERPERYAQATPLRLTPFGARQTLVAIAVLSPDEARDYAAAAKGDPVRVIELKTGGHFGRIAPNRAEWREVEQAIVAELKH